MLDFHLTKALRTDAGPGILDVRLTIAPGELVALVGPSGAGKTTLLRLLAGLTRPDGGHLRVGGEPWYDAGRRHWLPPQQRSIGFVFQDYALFPNMTVRQNLTFALPDARDQATVAELLELIDLEALADRLPAQLSGGQQQRVALARALARRPRLLLLDEPLSAVDQPTRLRLQQVLAQAHQRYGLTTVLVSHDPAEVRTLASRVVELEAGRVVRDGPPPLDATGWQLRFTVVELLPNHHARLRFDADGSTLIVPLPAERSYAVGEAVMLTDGGVSGM